MCSIFGVLDIKSDPSQLRAQAIEPLYDTNQ